MRWPAGTAWETRTFDALSLMRDEPTATWWEAALRNLPWGDGTVYQGAYVHRSALTDEPMRRAFLRHLRDEVLGTWRDHHPGHEPGRVRLHIEDAPEPLDNAVLAVAVVPQPHPPGTVCERCRMPG